MKLLPMMTCVEFILGKILGFSSTGFKVDFIEDFEAIFTYKTYYIADNYSEFKDAARVKFFKYN